MRIALSDGVIYDVVFSYPLLKRIDDEKQTYKDMRSTSCRIYSVKKAEQGFISKEIAVGRALCSDEDQFCKKSGRLIALTRALAVLSLSKEDRRDIWNMYNTEMGYLHARNKTRKVQENSTSELSVSA